jgi:hypothetical protein
MQPTVSRKIAKHVLIGTSSYPLFSICNPIAERQLSVADYYMPDDGYWPECRRFVVDDRRFAA